MTTVYLVRHSIKMRSPVKGTHKIYDYMQPLSVEGEDRARKLLDISELRGADAAYASTMSRSLATLRYIIEADGLPFSIDDRLRELDFGQPPEAQSEEIGPGNPAFEEFQVRRWLEPELIPINGESVVQCQERMNQAITEAVQEHMNQKILIGSHGAAICAYLSGILDHVNDDFVRNVNQPDIFELLFDGLDVVSCKHLQLPFPMRQPQGGPKPDGPKPVDGPPPR